MTMATNTWIAATATASLACALFAQTSGKPLSFEVASVKPAPPPETSSSAYAEGYAAGRRAALAAMGMRIAGQRVTLTDTHLKDLIHLAYGVSDGCIVGPAWISTEQYEVIAVMPAGAGRSQLPEMFKTLLTERFHLRTHMERKTMEVYALAAAKGGPKLRPSVAPAGGRGPNPFTFSSPRSVQARAATVATLAELLSKSINRLVIDATGLTGLYDFNLMFASDVSPTEDDAAPALATALQDQLGLRLQRRKMKVDVLLVDAADRTPVEN